MDPPNRWSSFAPEPTKRTAVYMSSTLPLLDRKRNQFLYININNDWIIIRSISQSSLPLQLQPVPNCKI